MDQQAAEPAEPAEPPEPIYIYFFKEEQWVDNKVCYRA